MDEKTKYCPLLTETGSLHLRECLKEHCAWYVRYYTGEGNCALKDIATSLAELGQRSQGKQKT